MRRIGARDRMQKHVVVWQRQGLDMGLAVGDDPYSKVGIILPQVINTVTITRRATELTWLTARNVKENRVGSELKLMVRAPPGYAIVGADVDPQELWISRAMGTHSSESSDFMVLRRLGGSRSRVGSAEALQHGDLSRDQFKVFNYLHIYFSLQANVDVLPGQAKRLAEQLYASSKGKGTQRADVFGRKFWFGGTVSFVFNKLEGITLSEQPTTPASQRSTFPPSSALTSRINWVVQYSPPAWSARVDYLYLLIVSMDHLIQPYDIEARCLISVHDRVCHLVAERDLHRAALALQIANLWT